MSYTSYSYLLIFLGSVFLCYTLSPKKYKWVVLLVSSYIFYMINSGKLAVFLVITTAAVYFAGVFINKINDGFALAKKGLEKEDRKKLKANIAWQKKAVVVSAGFKILGLFPAHGEIFGTSCAYKGAAAEIKVYTAARNILLHSAGGGVYYRRIPRQIPRYRKFRKISPVFKLFPADSGGSDRQVRSACR